MTLPDWLTLIVVFSTGGLIGMIIGLISGALSRPTLYDVEVALRYIVRQEVKRAMREDDE